MGDKEEESCENFESWEKQLYWQRFSPLSFILRLSDYDDYRRKIALPKKFSENMKGRIPEVVTLQGPSGSRFNVKITRPDNVLYMVDGWEEFVNSYSLVENNIIFCYYDGSSTIKVIIVDEESCCENGLSYFRKKCGHVHSHSQSRKRNRIATEIDDCEVHINHEDNNSEEDYVVAGAKPEPKSKSILREGDLDDVAHENPECENKSTTSLTETSMEVIHDDEGDDNGEDDCVEDVLTKKTGEETDCANPDPEKLQRVLGSHDESLPHKEPSNNEPSSGTQQQCSIPEENDDSLVKPPLLTPPSSTLAATNTASSGGRSRSMRSCRQHTTDNEDSSHKVGTGTSTGTGRRRTRGSHPISNSCQSGGKVITKAERDAAVAMARSKLDALSFYLVMNSNSRVNWKSSLMIPGAWFVRNLPRRSQDVTLTVEDKKWTVNLDYSGVKGRSLLASGWNKFVVRNHLREFDVCLFKLVSKSGPPVFEVTIFRVSTPQGVVALDCSPSSSHA